MLRPRKTLRTKFLSILLFQNFEKFMQAKTKHNQTKQSPQYNTSVFQFDIKEM